MKSLSAALIPLLTVLPFATANFDLYQVAENDIGGSFAAYAVFEAEPDCNGVLNYPTSFWQGAMDDVSGDKTGVRIEPTQAEAQKDPTQIDVLEMNFSEEPSYHFSKSIDLPLIGLL